MLLYTPFGKKASLFLKEIQKIMKILRDAFKMSYEAHVKRNMVKRVSFRRMPCGLKLTAPTGKPVGFTPLKRSM